MNGSRKRFTACDTQSYYFHHFGPSFFCSSLFAQIQTLLTPQTCIRTDLESDQRPCAPNRPSSTSHCPLKTARAGRTPVHTHIDSTWLRSCSVEFLWSWLLSSGFPLWSTLDWESRRGLFCVATEKMAQMFGQLQQLSQQLVNQQQMFQQSLEIQRQQSPNLALRKLPRQ